MPLMRSGSRSFTKALQEELFRYRASFETPAAPAPQDEVDLSLASKILLILRSAPFETPPAAAPQGRRARLAVRDAPLRRPLTGRGHRVQVQYTLNHRRSPPAPGRQ